MNVLVTLNKTSTGKIQLACVEITNNPEAMGTGYVLPPFGAHASGEIQLVLRNLGVSDDTIVRKMRLLSIMRTKEVVRVAELDVAEDIFRTNGFVAVLDEWRHEAGEYLVRGRSGQRERTSATPVRSPK